MIKPLAQADLDKVMQIWLQTNITTHAFIPAKYWQDNYVLVKRMLPSADVLVWQEDEVRGFLGLVKQSLIAGLFVEQNYQNLGIGSKLLELVQSLHPCLQLQVYVQNYPAINFYARHGFQIIDINEDAATKASQYTMSWPA